jgi:ABC-type transport system involved in multi-copper enzyme maturation permease subunit
MHRHSPSNPPTHPFGEVPRNLSKAADLLRVYLIYLLLSALFLGFLWWAITHYVEEPGAAAVLSVVFGGPFILLFSFVPLRFSMMYYPAPYDYRALHFFAALWFGITAGGAAPLGNWLCNNFSSLYLTRYRPSEKDQPH